MVPYFPHTEKDIEKMLAEIGVKNLEELFNDIPSCVRLEEPLSLPEGKAEYEVLKKAKEYAARNNVKAISFLGCGAYDHIIPSTVKPIISRSEFYTAYTPYQAEISQGILQSIFEFQSMVCRITGLDVSNASLYDGHTAAVEAAVMALNSAAKGGNTILYSATLHPYTKKVLDAHFGNTQVVLREIPEKEGVTDRKALMELLGPEIAGVICQTPNCYGYTEDLSGIAEEVHKAEALFIVSSNPLSLGLLKSQGEWGADIAVGDAQPLGLASYFGGPSVGYISAREQLLRKLPGRIVGQSLDVEGRRAFLLTLQAREQHIKRQRATSNICSNQALCALAVVVYLSTLGKEGFQEVAQLNYQKAHYLYNALTGKLSLKPLYKQEFFNEFTILLPKPAREVVKGMVDKGFFAGVPLVDLDPKADPKALVVAVTEKRTKEEMDNYTKALQEVLK